MKPIKNVTGTQNPGFLTQNERERLENVVEDLQSYAQTFVSQKAAEQNKQLAEWKAEDNRLREARLKKVKDEQTTPQEKVLAEIDAAIAPQLEQMRLSWLYTHGCEDDSEWDHKGKPHAIALLRADYIARQHKQNEINFRANHPFTL